MRKFLISAAAAAAALTMATPAAAQYYPPQPQGYAYGYHHNYGQVRRLQARIDHLQRQIRHLDRRGILSNREAARLFDESRAVERRLRNVSRYGLSGHERYQVESRIARLEHRIRREATDGNRWGNRRYGNRDGWRDRDRDGRNDRWEDDRGRDHD